MSRHLGHRVVIYNVGNKLRPFRANRLIWLLKIEKPNEIITRTKKMK